MVFPLAYQRMLMSQRTGPREATEARCLEEEGRRAGRRTASFERHTLDPPDTAGVSSSKVPPLCREKLECRRKHCTSLWLQAWGGGSYTDSLHTLLNGTLTCPSAGPPGVESHIAKIFG